MPDLTVFNVNGTMALRIDYSGKSKEPSIGIEERRIALSDNEAALGLDRLKILYDGGAFK